MIVKDFEIELLRFETRQNKNRLNELLDDSFIEFAQDWKKYNKNEIIEILPKCWEEEVEIIDYTEKELSENIILVNYNINRKILENGIKYSTLCSSIWQKDNWVWKMIFFQWTKIS